MDFASAVKHRLYLLALFSLLILTHAKLHVHQSDSDAYTTIKKHLGVNDQHNRKSVVWTITNRINNTSVLRITRIVLKSEGLAGFLSPEIGRLSELRELSLQNNHLVGQLPPQIVDCKKLEILNLHSNKFSGKITPELSSLNRLRILDFSSNKFSGNLTFLKYFPNLENLSIADNQFSGRIPYSIRSFRNLRFANFSGNLLENSVPFTTHVDFSASEFQKRYRLAENSTSRSFSTNKNISSAVAPTASKGGSTAPSPAPTHTNKKKSKNNKTRGWIIGFLAGALAGCVSGFICSLLFKLLLGIIKGGKEKSGLEIYSQAIKKTDLAFLEKEDGLASLEIIGRGGCGEVYRAELPDCNIKTIAVKKIIQLPKEAVAELNEEDSKALGKKMRQIRSEIQTVGKVRHRNLLPLLAHLCRPDCHYLVYEYMRNGSLRDLLNDVARGTKELNWLARHKIALGVACGLEYLHIEQKPHIIHRDLKPENILLDDDMEARIADFGLAKAIPDGNTHMSTSNVAGTWGYIAPEYHQTFKFTDKCDIYSFGVILGVLVIGKLPSDEFFLQSDDIGIVKWMRNVIMSENPREAIDPILLGTGHEEQILLMLKIACFCTVDDPKQRPNSKDVKVMLSQIPH